MERMDHMDFFCTECAKIFATEVDLVIHQTKVHDNRSFSCEICHAISVDDFYNDSFPIDLLPADLDQAFMLPNNV